MHYEANRKVKLMHMYLCYIYKHKLLGVFLQRYFIKPQTALSVDTQIFLDGRDRITMSLIKQ